MNSCDFNPERDPEMVFKVLGLLIGPIFWLVDRIISRSQEHDHNEETPKKTKTGALRAKLGISPPKPRPRKDTPPSGTA